MKRAAVFATLITAFLLTVCALSTPAQGVPIIPDGNKIEGAWDSSIVYKDCGTGTVLFTGNTMYAYAQGGVLTAITVGASPASRYPGLGVWRRISGSQYEATFKEFRYNPDGTFAGKVIVVSQITHESNDTLSTRAVGTFYDVAGMPIASVCPTGVAVRFTGEQ